MSPHTFSRAAVALAALASSLSSAPQLPSNAYKVLDNVEGTYVNLGAVPIRPMALSANQLVLYAVNTHGSAVDVFTDLSGNPSAVWPTPWNPVSLALWDDDQSAGRVLVACRGTSAVVMLDRTTGEILKLLETSPEPGDLLVDATADRAFVSCAGRDVVQEIDLDAWTIVRTFALPAKLPLRLCFDANMDVLVAPLLSGNNSVIHNVFGLNAGLLGILDLDNPAIAVPGSTLPDHDVFRLVRSSPVGSPVVEPIVRRAGTLLFGMGINPATGDLWVLNTEANNKDPNKQSEGAIRGDVVENRLTIVPAASIPAAGSGIVFQPTPAMIHDLDGPDTDPLTPGDQYDVTKTVGQPDGLSFVAGGYALITGVLTDNLTVLDSTGAFVAEWNLDTAMVDEGEIPRATLFSPLTGFVYVYCWGTNRIQVWSGAPASLVKELDLGPDPAPAIVKEGRRLFYDGKKSANQNASCHSCHPNGGTDMQLWNLSNLDEDDKGPLVTQTLMGIDRTVPLHWRGEQQIGLVDFNPAFVKLLGAANELPLPDLGIQDFDAFEAFVTGLRNSPNPHQHVSRILDDAIQPPMMAGAPTAFARQGQLDFIASSAGDDCEVCHVFPSGGNNEIQNTSFFDLNPRRQRFEVAHFFDLHRKEQDADRTTATIDTAFVDFVSTAMVDQPYPVVGAGILHAGVADSVHEFVAAFGGITPQHAANITSFMHQWDQGLAPATYRGFLLDQASVAVVSTRLTGYLKGQADARHCDIAAFGTVTVGGVSRQARWSYDRRLGTFTADDSSLGQQALSFFIAQATSGQGRNVFLGLPVGMGRRFAVDRDEDDLVDRDEVLVWGTNPRLPDSDGDGDPDGHEANNLPFPGSDAPSNPAVQSNDTTAPTVVSARTQWLTTANGTLTFETDEPTQVTVNYSTPAGSSGSKSDLAFSRHHRIVLTDLTPSIPNGAQHAYTGTVAFTDLGGQTATLAQLPASPSGFLAPAFPGQPVSNTTRDLGVTTDAVVADLAWTSGPTHGAGTMSGTATIRGELEIGNLPGPQPPAVVVFRVLVNGQVHANVSPSFASFDLFIPDDPSTPVNEQAVVPYTAIPGTLAGPFLVCPLTDTTGTTTVTFTASGLQSGDEVTLNVELIGAPGPNHSPTNPEIHRNFFNVWSMPDTPAALRKLVEQQP